MWSSSGPEIRAWYSVRQRSPRRQVARLARHAAPAWVHRRHRLDTRRIGNTMVGARDHAVARLQRLAQRIECLRGEFRHFVEEQQAVMRKRHFARPRAQAAANHRRHRGPNDAARGTAVGPSACLRRARRRRKRSSRLRAAPSAPAAEGSRAGVAPAFDLPKPGGPTISIGGSPEAAPVASCDGLVAHVKIGKTALCEAL